MRYLVRPRLFKRQIVLRCTLTVLCGLLFVLAACGEQQQSTTPKKIETVNVGTFGVLGDAPVYIALEKGYFRQQGIDIKINPITGSLTNLVAGLASGSLDVGDGSATSALYNAFGNNINLRIVADNAHIEPGHSSGALVVRNELANTIKTAADLKGRKIAVLTVKGSTSLIYVEKVLKPAGLAIQDVNLVAMPFPDMLPALTNGSVDAAIIVEPFLVNGLQQHIFSVFKDLGEIYPQGEGNVTVYSAQFTQHKELAKAFMVAHLKGARDYYEAFFKNKNRADIVRILTKYTSLKQPEVYDHLNFSAINTNGRVNQKTMQDDLDWFIKHGDVTTNVSISSVVDNSYVDNAVHILGSYPAS